MSTPRTDAEIYLSPKDTALIGIPVVTAEFARKLETELATARAEVYAECSRICREKQRGLLNILEYDNACNECAEAIEAAAGKEG